MRVVNRFSDDFRAEALKLMRRGDRPVQRLADDLGVSHWTLRSWYRADEMARRKGKRSKISGDAQPLSLRAESVEERVERLERENERLRRENARLEEDRAILKKAAAFFAKESG